jgi:signal transduction histidine kinase
MANQEREQLVKRDRVVTDTNLVTERGRTDDSLVELRKRAEFETDKKVQDDRQVADDARALNRSDSDLRLGSTTLSKSVDRQRQFDDTATRTERVKMDAAILRERTLKDAVINEFLHSEREETDDSLLNERESVDTVVLRTTKLLAEEVILHSTTKAALTTRDEFLAIVSHDLRNPIGAVVSCAEMLLEDPELNGKMNSEIMGWIEFMKRNSQRSLRLINDLLDMEHVAQGKLTLTSALHDIGLMVRNAIQNSAHVSSIKKISVKATGVDEAWVTCDRDRIMQVMTNLLSNALKFAPENGHVEVKTEEASDEIRISVIDNGPGIPTEHCERIFDRFAQLQNKDRRGLGLGLYISKMFVEAHHGKISVNCKPGHGCTFTFTIPK